MQLLKTTALAALIGLAAAAAATASDEEQLKAGKRVYMTKTCLACHGRGGAAPVLSYPMLAGQSADYIVAQMEAIRDGERVGSVDPTTGRIEHLAWEGQGCSISMASAWARTTATTTTR